VLARVVHSDVDQFAQQQGLTNSLVSTGFIGASLLGAKLAKNNRTIISMVYCSPILGLLSCVFLIISLKLMAFLYVSALLSGIGTYCFRISGMTLGQAFTPPSTLGPVIIAGDTIVRAWSFLVSITTLAIFHTANLFDLSFYNFLALAVLVPAFSLLAPIWTLQLAKKFALRNQKAMET
jgi:MFS family permease